MARKSIILQLALATLIAMPMVALLIDHFSDTVDIRAMIIGNGKIGMHVLFGLIAGLGIAVIAQLIIVSPLLNQVNTQYANLLGRFKLTFSEIAFVSLCAGVGEEILFRGAIQPFFGVIFTSLFFVAIHGYISPKNWRLTVYGLYMTVGICLLGYLSVTQGLLTAIVAHTVIDIYLLLHLQRTAKVVPVIENPDLQDTEEDHTENYN